MAKIAALDEPSLEWARTRFATYYRAEALSAPSRLNRREFAAFPFAANVLMRRHTALRSEEELRGFLAQEVPRHVYYSSAYYRIPDAPTMEKKEWLGADVIFDLDADHLKGADKLAYAEQLDRVRDKVRDLFDDFLVGDFGLDPASMHLFFSGGRGYHVHVQDPTYLNLTSAERREIVDYIIGMGFDPASAVRESRGTSDTSTIVGDPSDEAPSAPRVPRAGGNRAFKALFPPDAPGWKGRLSRAVLLVLAHWRKEGVERAAADLTSAGVPHRGAVRLAKQLIVEGYAERIQEGLSLDVFPREVRPELLDAVLRVATIEIQGETDAPVTTDIHRLIRLPGSLHGGTGFRVAPVARDALERFDPLRDAVAKVWGTTTASVELRESVDYPFDGQRVAGRSGDVAVLPTAQALFLILRGEAALRPGPGP
ncbi:MAG: DNA primase small subunit PriS [Thermoplasmata archaeon]